MNGSAPIEVGLGLGSNLGDRIASLVAARQQISAIPGIRLLAWSSLYETEPVGVKPEYQHLKFINAVVVVLSEIPLEDLHRQLMAVEAGIGRERTSDKFAPRPLDIDVLFAGSLVLDTPALKLPHPQCLKRRFVLEPLFEIAPELVIAPTALTVRQLLEGLPPSEPVARLPDAW